MKIHGMCTVAARNTPAVMLTGVQNQNVIRPHRIHNPVLLDLPFAFQQIDEIMLLHYTIHVNNACFIQIVISARHAPTGTGTKTAVLHNRPPATALLSLHRIHYT